MKKTLLFYNLYPKTNWEEITRKLLQKVPHDEIIVHVSLPGFPFLRKYKVKKELSKYPKIKTILFSKNAKNRGESVGLEKLRQEVLLTPYSTLTYIHSKGSSKRRKNTPPIQDWTEMMRYFVVERHDLALQKFQEGFELYGVNLFHHPPQDAAPEVKFHYSGNFVSINLDKLLNKFLQAPCQPNYFGVESFWGALTTYENAYCIHQSETNHYEDIYPPTKYR